MRTLELSKILPLVYPLIAACEPAVERPATIPAVSGVSGALDSAFRIRETLDHTGGERPAREYEARHPVFNMAAKFDTAGVHLRARRSGEELLSLQPRRWGRGDELAPMAHAEPRVAENRLVFERGRVTEWYEHGPRGIEQGFTLAEPPDTKVRSLPLRVEMRVSSPHRTDLTEQRGAILISTGGGRPAVRYSDLAVNDANGKSLPSRMWAARDHIVIEVDDASARYPLVIDPYIITETKVLAAEDIANSYFGAAVAIDADTAVVASHDHDAHGPGTSTGSVDVYVREGGGWRYQQKLLGESEVEENFASSVAVFGDTIVVGCWESAYVFDRVGLGWSQPVKLTGSDVIAGHLFGISVAIDGDTIVVGASGSAFTATYAGAAYVFERNLGGANAWGERVKLVASDGQPKERFGYTVDVQGDVLAVGTPYVPGGAGQNEGRVYVYYRDAGGIDSWGGGLEVKQIVAPDAASDDFFGNGVGVHADTIVVGSLWTSFTGAGYVFQRDVGGTDNWGFVKKLQAPDPQGALLMGDAVAFDGDLAVLGAPGDDSQGSAYVFGRNQGGTDNWGFVVKLTAADGALGDYFGLSVGVSGTSVIAGAYADDNDMGANSGSAYVYDRDVGGPGAWGEQAKIVGTDRDFYGFGLAVDGDVAIVGAPTDQVNGPESGIVYVMQRTGDVWVESQQLIPSGGAAGDWFGNAIAMDGDLAVVGAPSVVGIGAAYVFVRSVGWSEQAKLVPADAQAGDWLGQAVDVSGDYVVVGAPYHTVGSDFCAGAAYVFWRNQGGTNNWGLQATLVASDAGPIGTFGWSASLNGDTLVIGAIMATAGSTPHAGAAYVFTRSGSVWLEQAKLTAPDPAVTGFFGHSLALDGTSVLIGAAGDREVASYAGAAYVFTGSGSSWSLQQKLIGTDVAEGDQSGFAVALAGDVALVGARFSDGDGIADSGAVHVFMRSGDVWAEAMRLTATDATPGAHLGTGLSASGTTALVGAPEGLGYGGFSGAVYDFDIALDTDGDGVPDSSDACADDSNKTAAGVCGCGVADTDSDGDGTSDCNDDCPSDANKTAAGVCGCGVADTDTDSDGTPNCNDDCESDPDKTAAGVCGCGVADTDTDSDGTSDCNDGCPSDPAKTAAGACGCGVADTDSDGDGTSDCNDDCPSDANKTAAGVCGCGVADTDTDSDGTPDCVDPCPNDSSDACSDGGPLDDGAPSDGAGYGDDAPGPGDPERIAGPTVVSGGCGCWAGRESGGVAWLAGLAVVLATRTRRRS